MCVYYTYISNIVEQILRGGEKKIKYKRSNATCVVHRVDKRCEGGASIILRKFSILVRKRYEEKINSGMVHLYQIFWK